MRNKFGQFVKGHHASPGTEFKKGKRYSPSTEFKKRNKAYWKGGIKKHSSGYILIIRHDHPRSINGYVKRSYLVMEKHINRFLKPEEVVHHINSIKDDDRIKNLKLFKNHSEHQKHHYFLRERDSNGRFT